MKKYALALHGGAGIMPRPSDPALIEAYLQGLQEALEAGIALLAQNKSSLDAVEAVVRTLEDNPLFNAGRGAVFTHEGKHELDASIMDGRTLGCGAIACVRSLKNPVSLARKVMERTPHVLLAGPQAEQFSIEMGMERCEDSYFFSQMRYEQWQKACAREKTSHDYAFREDQYRATKDKGTVGAVALDEHGNLAAATSTGGITNKRYGRVGDSALIGCGSYADNRTCAVSCTGNGEAFIRHVAAHDVHCQMLYAGRALSEAATQVIHHSLQPGDGGLVAVDREGNTVFAYSSEGMYRAAADADGKFIVKIWE